MEVSNNNKYEYIIPVRFRLSDKAYSFGSNNLDYKKDDYVVVETIRGVELGIVSDAPKKNNSSFGLEIKPIIRKATIKDVEDDKKNREDEKIAMEICRKSIEDMDLPMTLTSAEYTLDRGKVVFTYVAEERVDFRELLKVLAAKFHTRIELRQIGPRDKAKLVGGIGLCGLTLCCNRFQKEFGTISINMAKNQLLALNPQKLSGQCGKLMCCLAYENEDYKILRQGLPKMNASVIYENNRYRITSMNVLDNSARLSNSESYVDLSLDELKELIKNNEKNNITVQNHVKKEAENAVKKSTALDRDKLKNHKQGV